MNSSSARDALQAYLTSLRTADTSAGGGGPARRLVRAIVSPSRRGALAMSATDLRRPWDRRRADTISRRGPLRLHLGSAWQPIEGWVNVDLVGHPVDLTWNLARGLPFPDGSAEAIFHEHLLEHLPWEAAARLLDESFRVLTGGGVTRIAVPDAGRYLLSYTKGGEGLINEYRAGRPTRMIAVHEVFHLHGHRSAWDGETLDLFTRAAGFEECEARAFGASRLDPCPDSPHREQESLYFEAVKGPSAAT